MHDLLVSAVWLAGSIVGKLSDPTSWVVIVAMLCAGFARWPRWIIPFAAALATALNVILVYPWWVELGFASTAAQRSLTIFLVTLLICAAGYGLGWIAARVARRSPA